jgi:phosphatidate cytidylyltransferase
MLAQRIRTAIISLAILGIVIFIVPPIVARLFIAGVFLAGAWEWGGFLFAEGRAGRIAYMAFIAALMGLTWYLMGDPAWFMQILKIGLAWWMLALVWVLLFPTPIPALLSWLCGGLVLVPAWAALDNLYTQQSPIMLIFVLLIVWVADMGAFFVGKGFGRVKLAPAVSPGKTWEGVLGGLAAATLLAAAASAVFSWDIRVLVPFCLAVSLISIVGDLSVSMFKRTAGVKDSGSLFPGHGGVLDRIDSVAAAAPLFVLALTWIGFDR